MLKNFLLILISVFCLSNSFAAESTEEASSTLCVGTFPNPVTDVCWSCMFPIKIGPISINAGSENDDGGAPPLLCMCPAPPPQFVAYGVGVSFWEPARISEVVRTPMCSPTLSGQTLGSVNAPRGTNHEGDDQGRAFYHVHWITYPILSWLGMAITDSVCHDGSEGFDMAYMSELDPLWDDDETSFVLNPEAVLFATPIAQAACVADSVKASLTNFGFDALFWCSGSQGSLYPLSGTHASHVSGIDSSLALTHTMIFKLHRQFLAQDTSTNSALCGSVSQPIMRKNQYKQQMLFPIPQTRKCYGIGVPSQVWATGREFPYRGEDFSYLVWRKRTCCVTGY